MNEGYAICLNEWIFDTRIKNELNLLLLISSYTAEKGYCYASNEHFAKKFNIDEATISRKIKKLWQFGYITISYKRRGCEITDREIRLTNLSNNTQKCQSSNDENVNRTNDEKVKENNTSINNTSINKSTNDFFETFWSIYPKRVGKQKALEKYKKAIKEGIDPKKILEAVEKYNEQIKFKKLDEQYIKHPATWLNHGCWDDEFITKEEKGGTIERYNPYS